MLEQRANDGPFGGGYGAVLAIRLSDAHQGAAARLHDGPDVGEIEIDQPWHRDELGDGADTVVQHLVRQAEGVEEGNVVLTEGGDPVVGDDDQGVDVFFETTEAFQSVFVALGAFKTERQGDDRHGQRAGFPGHFGDDGRGARAGAAAQTGGQEDHVGAFQDFGDAFPVFEGGFLADLGFCARAEAPGDPGPNLEAGAGGRAFEGLRVGIERDELDILESSLDHPADGVAAAAADAAYLDDGAIFKGLIFV